MEKMKEQEKANKVGKATEFFSVYAQPTEQVVAKEIDSKPRTVLFQGGEDDMTKVPLDIAMSNVSVVDVHKTLSGVNRLKTMDVYVPRYIMLSYKDDQLVVNVTCMRVDALQMMCIAKE